MTNQDWQPIETAPRDGTRVLLWACDPCYPKGKPLVGYFENNKWHLSGHEFTECWINNFDEYFNPTHWMPLPEPPKEEQ